MARTNRLRRGGKEGVGNMLSDEADAVGVMICVDEYFIGYSMVEPVGVGGVEGGKPDRCGLAG